MSSASVLRILSVDDGIVSHLFLCPGSCCYLCNPRASGVISIVTLGVCQLSKCLLAYTLIPAYASDI